LPDYPSLGVGVHLNPTEGQAVSEGTTTLVDRSGKFFPPVGTFSGAHLESDQRQRHSEGIPRSGRSLQESDWQGCPHLDTHQNIYLHPLIFSGVLTLGRTLSCPIRLHRESIHLLPNGRGRYFRQLGRSLMGAGYHLWARSSQIRTPEYFFHLNDYFADRLDDRNFLVKTFCDRLAHLPRGVSELMVHAAYCDDELIRLTHGSKIMAQQRTEEFYALCDPRLQTQITVHGIDLIHFGRLIMTGSSVSNPHAREMKSIREDQGRA
jgi:predicted glycoside hydrolase/deacetylase ChbG (UPF0249 family)